MERGGWPRSCRACLGSLHGLELLKEATKLVGVGQSVFLSGHHFRCVALTLPGMWKMRHDEAWPSAHSASGFVGTAGDGTLHVSLCLPGPANCMIAMTAL